MYGRLPALFRTHCTGLWSPPTQRMQAKRLIQPCELFTPVLSFPRATVQHFEPHPLMFISYSLHSMQTLRIVPPCMDVFYCAVLSELSTFLLSTASSTRKHTEYLRAATKGLKCKNHVSYPKCTPSIPLLFHIYSTCITRAQHIWPHPLPITCTAHTQ